MILSALNSTAADVCGDCGIVIAGGRAVVTAAAVKFLIGKRLRRKLILMEKAGLDIAALTAEKFGLAGRHAMARHILKLTTRRQPAPPRWRGISQDGD